MKLAVTLWFIWNYILTKAIVVVISRPSLLPAATNAIIFFNFSPKPVSFHFSFQTFSATFQFF